MLFIQIYGLDVLMSAHFPVIIAQFKHVKHHQPSALPLCQDLSKSFTVEDSASFLFLRLIKVVHGHRWPMPPEPQVRNTLRRKLFTMKGTNDRICVYLFTNDNKDYTPGRVEKCNAVVARPT